MFLRLIVSTLLILASHAARAEQPAWESHSLGEGARADYLIPGLASPGSVRDEPAATLIQAADSGGSENMKQAHAARIAASANHRHHVAVEGRLFVQIDDPDFVEREVLRLLEGLEND
jgi:hypothetical protein